MLKYIYIYMSIHSHILLCRMAVPRFQVQPPAPAAAQHVGEPRGLDVENNPTSMRGSIDWFKGKITGKPRI